jgi:error-prone DNA polymerase
MEDLPEYRGKLQAPLWRDLVTLTQEIRGLPRHVTQHVGGVVLSARPLQGFVPLEPTRMDGRVMCQWDKDSVDDARMVKIDFLALGMLSLVDECLELIEQRHGQRPDLGRVDHEDRAVYDQICASDTIGLFQIESRAQISTLAHTQPRTLDDLAVQVAIVRPGPIVSGAFKPYMEYRRRLKAGEPVTVKYLHPYLEPVLKDTVGVVLYQEQVVQVAMAIAGYSAGEADRLRRNLNRRHGAELAEKDWPEFLERARNRGIPDEATQATFRSIMGFAAYGFPKSHAVAFALLAYESAWLRFYYPAEYYTALFNNQPMGFYSTEVIAGDARRHGLEIARPDINRSDSRCTVEGESVIRLGLAEVKSVGENLAKAIVAVREEGGSYGSVRDCADRVGLSPEARENLILAGAFDDLNPRHRRELLWESGLVKSTALRHVMPQRSIARETTGDAAAQGDNVQSSGRQASSKQRFRQGMLPLPIEQDFVALAPMTNWEALAAEYETIGLSPNQHAMEVLRPALRSAENQVLSPEKPTRISTQHSAHSTQHWELRTSAEVRAIPDGQTVRLAGLVTCRQRPSTAKGVVFVSLEDEYGLANVVVYARLFHQQRRLLLTEAFLIVQGRVQRQGDVVHIVAHHFEQPRIQNGHLIRVSHDFR